MSAFGTCFDSCTLVVNGCINCGLFSAVPNVFLHNWKALVIQQTKYRNRVIVTSVLWRK